MFGELWRVLRRDGTVWLNMGDSYTSGGRTGHGNRVGHKQETNRGCWGLQQYRSPQPAGLKPKDLCGIPWRVALALQQDGWWLRSDIVWAKPNAMPESVRDRPTRSHDYVFLLAKAQRYFFDQEAVKEPVTGNTHSRGHGVNPKARMPGANSRIYQHRDPQHPAAHKVRQNESFSAAVAGPVARRNIRSVWTVPTQPYREAHFATFPEKLVEPCIKAGTSEKGCCPTCGSPWKPVLEHQKHALASKNDAGPGQRVGVSNAEWRTEHRQSTGQRMSENTRSARDAGGAHDQPFASPRMIGWQPGCTCNAGDPVPCVVLARRALPLPCSCRSRSLWCWPTPC